MFWTMAWSRASAGAQGFLGEPRVGDVVDDADEAERGAVAVAHDLCALVHPFLEAERRTMRCSTS